MCSPTEGGSGKKMRQPEQAKDRSGRTGKKTEDNKSMNLFCGRHGVMKAIY